MFRNILIIVGSILLIALFVFWIYLLIFGTPKEVGNLVNEWKLSEYNTERPPIYGETENQVDIAKTSLNQLTTEPVAGFISKTSSTTNTILYAERGTGHIYEIELDSGNQTRISGTTIGKAVGATFSLNNYVVFISENNLSTKADLYEIKQDKAVLIENLPPGSNNFNFFKDDYLNYTTPNNSGGLVAKSHNLKTGEEQVLWEIPFKQANIYWELNKTYVVNLPAPYLEGNIYILDNLTRLHEPLYSFVAKPNKSGIIYETYYDFQTESLRSRLLDNTGIEITTLPVIAIPEKCTSLSNNELWCAAPLPDNKLSRTSLSKWYMGTISMEDFLWQIDIDNRRANLAKDFFGDLGFQIDVENMTLGSDSKSLFFTNKLNDTLWTYRITEATKELGTENETLTTDDGEPQTLEE